MRYIILLLLSMLVATTAATTTQAQNTISTADSLELVRFYHALDGDNWFDNTGWILAPVHEWYGVVIYENPKSYALWLQGNNLTGELIDLNIPDLTHVVVDGNNISGKVPAYSQTKLYRLGVSSTNVTELPDFNLPLGHIGARGCQLTKLPSFEGVKTTLISLDVKDNNITSPCPSFDGFPNLRSVDLQGNNISGSLPTFNESDLLVSISLDELQLTGPIPDWSHLTNLVSIDLDNNQLSGELDAEMFKSFTNIDNLELQNNNFTGTIPCLDAPNLHTALFSNNNFTGCDLNLDLLPNLDILWMSSNMLNFDWLESNVPDFSIIWTYLPQRCQPILYQKNDTLFVEAGGTTALNEYRFYKDNNLIETLQGTDYLVISEPGVYSCRISNSNVPNLNLCAYDWEVQGFCEEEQACVLPGDANNNNSINVYDLPQIGRAYGSAGLARANQDTRPIRQTSTDWQTSFAEINHKYADCDGNGRIDSLDADVILENYGEIGNEILSPVQNDGIPLTIGVPDTVVAGLEYSYPVLIEEIVSFYAISFQVIAVANSSDVRINNPQISLANTFVDDDGSYILSIDRHESFDNTTFTWHISITRTNQIDLNSSGILCSLECIMDVPSIDKATEGAGVPINIELKNIQIGDFEGNIYPVRTPDEQQFILSSGASQAEIVRVEDFSIVSPKSFQIYPNPVAHDGRLTIDCAACSTVQSVEFQLFDVTGKLVHQFARSAFAKTTASFDLPASLPSGLYFLVGQNHEGAVLGSSKVVVE